VDVDRFIAEHRQRWVRLEELAGRARRTVRSLDADELEELVHLYQATSGDLAFVRTHYDDTALIRRLSFVLGMARGTIYRTRTHPGVSVVRFVTRTFPAAMWECRRQFAIAALLLLAPAVASGVWLGVNDTARDAIVEPEQQALLAERDFEEYYQSEAAASFQTRVTVNNIQVGVMAFVGGILGGIPTAFILISNGLNVGVAGAVMHEYGQGAQFWGLLTPHGLLELTAVFVASAAGLRLGWTLIAPGDRRRSQALAEEGLRAVVLVIGAAICFLMAGFIEAWVTPSNLGTWARVGIGVIVELAFLAYAFGVGRIAAVEGYSGSFAESPGEDRASARAEPVLVAPESYNRPADLIDK
jgi:uncharacterized membrane protein SpoIIM required for sporulation